MNNLVAKNARKFNKSATMTDRKKRVKAGYSKHKKTPRDESRGFVLWENIIQKVLDFNIR